LKSQKSQKKKFINKERNEKVEFIKQKNQDQKQTTRRAKEF
jgi:hypothetical protein